VVLSCPIPQTTTRLYGKHEKAVCWVIDAADENCQNNIEVGVIEARIGKLRIVDKEPGAMLQFSPSYRVWYASTRIHLNKLDAQGFLGLWKAALADESNHVIVHEPELEPRRDHEETPLEILRKKNVADIRQAEQDFFASLGEVAPPPKKRNARKQVQVSGERRRSSRIARTVAVNEEEDGACMDIRDCLVTHGKKRKKATDEDAVINDESVLEIEANVTLNVKAAGSSSSPARRPARTHEDSSSKESSSEDSSSEDSSSEDSSTEDSSSEDSSSEAEESSSEDASLPESSDSDGPD